MKRIKAKDVKIGEWVLIKSLNGDVWFQACINNMKMDITFEGYIIIRDNIEDFEIWVDTLSHYQYDKKYQILRLTKRELEKYHSIRLLGLLKI